MPRDSSGDYTRPSGQPVTAGTNITASAQNTWSADVATEITDSLSRSGKGGMTAALKLPNGTVALPALAFTSDPDTGAYHIGADNFGIAAGGVLIQDWSPTQATFGKSVVATGTGANPGVKGNGGATDGYGLHGVGGGTNGGGGKFENAGSGSGIDVVQVGGGIGVNVTAQSGAVGACGNFNATAGSGYGMQLSGNATKAPLLIAGLASAPSAPDNGAVYYDTTLGKLRVRAAGAWVDLH